MSEGPLNKQQVIDRLQKQGLLAEKSSKEWGAAGDKINEAYRNGMAYAYQDALELVECIVAPGDYPLVKPLVKRKVNSCP